MRDAEGRIIAQPHTAVRTGAWIGTLAEIDIARRAAPVLQRERQGPNDYRSAEKKEQRGRGAVDESIVLQPNPNQCDRSDGEGQRALSRAPLLELFDDALFESHVDRSESTAVFGTLLREARRSGERFLILE